MDTERRTQVMDIGFEIMKHMRVPLIALWLAEDGWEGGSTIVAERLDDQHVQLAIYEFPQLSISSDLNPN